MSEWQPIEGDPDYSVAPWNGDDVLLLWRGTNLCIVACFDKDHEFYPWQTLDGPSYAVGIPSHWMPLPEPPVLKSPERGTTP